MMGKQIFLQVLLKIFKYVKNVLRYLDVVFFELNCLRRISLITRTFRLVTISTNFHFDLLTDREKNFIPDDKSRLLSY